MIECSYITDYIDFVRSGRYPVSQWQFKFCDFVEKIFDEEKLFIDMEQAEKYLALEKYFPYKLFPWEKCCFVLHNCVYDEFGNLRFPILVIYVGRGAGKNGYLSFEDFALLTPINGIREYDIDIFATSEDQAKASFDDVYNVLEANKAKMKNHFHWTKTAITNLKTKSTLRFRTSAPKTKDGGRPGKVDFDEYHAYEDTKLIGVAVTGLGKRPHPRRTIITTNGNVRGKVFDTAIIKWKEILEFKKPDNGTLPFLCELDSDEEIEQPEMWYKANPSLQYRPDLLHELKLEFADYLEDKIMYSDFATKRMNRPPKVFEGQVTSWENILRTERDIPEEKLKGRICVAGFDYMKTTDFMAAGLLYLVDGEYIWITHSWVLRNSPDLKKIKAPLQEWAAAGLLDIVDGDEIPPELPVVWVMNEAAKRNSRIVRIGVDSYRYTLLSKALKDYYFSPEKEYGANIKLIRPSDEMKVIPLITSGFINAIFNWGHNPLMRWYCNNSKEEKVGVNIIYGKIEPDSRKTDGFKAFVQAFCVSDVLNSAEVYSGNSNIYDVIVI